MQITFLGTSSCRFNAGDDTVHFLIDGRVLVDTGWQVAGNLLKFGVDPLAVKHLLFTHFHHDHYIGLVGFMFYLQGKRANDNTTLYGPAQDIDHVVDLAEAFLQKDRYFPDALRPKTVGLPDEGTLRIDDLQVDFIKAIHPVDARSYRFKSGGNCVGVSGDTTYNKRAVPFYEGCDLLVHEASLGPVRADPGNNAALHSGAVDAAQMARDAGVPRLMLVHGDTDKAEESIAAAKAVFDGDVSWPRPGQTVRV